VGGECIVFIFRLLKQREILYGISQGKKSASYGLKECGIPDFKIHFTDLCGDIMLSHMSLVTFCWLA